MANRNETFGRLLSGAINSIATYEGKTAPSIEEELGQQIGVVGKTVQRYKAGHIPPDAASVALLAEAAVRRGFLGREWLYRFLQAARYPIPDRLLNTLCPVPQTSPQPTRVYENLPAPTYSQFVMRSQAFAEVLDGLQQRSAAVLIVGLGGTGKTSLAREVAARCLRGDEVPRFDAVVWVSDKDRPGTTNLSIVLDEIARTLDYPGFTQFEHDEKQREVAQLLRRQCVLLVVDNFETITDGILLTWLLRLPEPSKALITSREYVREFRNSTIITELRGMSDAEARGLIEQRLRILRIEKMVGNVAWQESLVAATGGNPKAIELTLGLAKYERRPLQQVIDDLYTARGELFEDLFARAWALLDDAARRVLLVATFFPTSANAEALSTSADVQSFAFSRAVERLTDLALLDVQQADLSSLPRYELHPLVGAFSRAQLIEHQGFADRARARWVGWYAALTAQQDLWTDLSWMDVLEHEAETALDVLRWTFRHQHYADALELSRMVACYYSIRGEWNILMEIRHLEFHAAHAAENHAREIRALCDLIENYGLQGQFGEAQQYIERLTVLQGSASLSVTEEVTIRQHMAMYLIQKRDLDEAQQMLLHELEQGGGLLPYMYSWDKYLRALCFYRAGDEKEAYSIFIEALQKAQAVNYIRGIDFASLQLASIAIDWGDSLQAEHYLSKNEARTRARQDRRLLGPIKYQIARLHILRDDLLAARTALEEAIDLFERMGMRRKLDEARADLARLGTLGAPGCRQIGRDGPIDHAYDAGGSSSPKRES